MTKDEQIEEMTNIIFKSSPIPSVWRSDAVRFAEALYTADYRKQEWIRVEDRLPEKSCEVLTVDRTGVMCLAPYSDRYKAFNATDEDDGDRWKLTVTHWMPLPEAPKMKGGELYDS